MAAFELLTLNKQLATSPLQGVEVSCENDEIYVKIMRDMNLRIVYEENAKVFMTITKENQVQLLHDIKKEVECIDLLVSLSQGSKVNQLIVHESAALHINEQYEIHRNAKLACAFGELSPGTCDHTANYRMVGQGSDLQATYVFMNAQKSQKNYHVVVNHETGYTTANVENYGVVAQESKLRVNIDAKIAKGSIQSATHQTSRILTFEEGVLAKVTPSLYIDENDVQASHACSMGVIDENHLYYLQSRGLTRKEAVGLIVSGYLSPLSEIYVGDELRDEVSHMIESKAGEYIGYQIDSQ